MSVERELGSLSARIDTLEKHIEEVQKSNKEILATVNARGGAIKMLNTLWLVCVCIVTLKFGDIFELFRR